LIGGTAVRFYGRCSVVASISGLGSMMIMRGARGRVLEKTIGLLYRYSFGKNPMKVIFQNEDDKVKITSIAKLPASKVVLIPGSGVDLTVFQPRGNERTHIQSVVLASRMLRDKGVLEFIDAVRWLRANFLEIKQRVSFILVGDPDPDNPTSLTLSELKDWVSEGLVEHWSYRADMPEVFANAYMVVLPSYREGFPKVLMEAAACGRAVITTDVPGCRDAIEPGRSGILVPPRDFKALALAIKSLLDDRVRCEAMGRVGRDLAERAFDVRRVVIRHMELYDELLSAQGE
jgi:glycosyltransferase involved in cell wall biosynthesis